MLIRLFGPFEKLAGKEITLELERPMTLRELIGRLSTRFPGFALYAEKTNDAELSAHVAFVKDGRVLKLEDRVEKGDTLQVLLPVTGG